MTVASRFPQSKRFLCHTTRGVENYCCAKCGLSALRQVKAQVKEVRVGDYTTSKLINGKEAYFVEGYFTESPCCEGALIAFEYRQDARKFIFKGGGRIVNLQGKMILDHKTVPFQNKPWIYLAIAAVCSAIFFSIGKRSQGGKRRSVLIARSLLVFITTFSLVTAFGGGLETKEL